MPYHTYTSLYHVQYRYTGISVSIHRYISVLVSGKYQYYLGFITVSWVECTLGWYVYGIYQAHHTIREYHTHTDIYHSISNLCVYDNTVHG